MLVSQQLPCRPNDLLERLRPVPMERPGLHNLGTPVYNLRCSSRPVHPARRRPCREGGGTLVAHVSDLEGSVFLVTGIPAAGKSTVADELARRFGRSVHVRGDVFRRMVVSGRVAMSHSPLPEAWAQLRLRYRLTAMTADTWHDAGFTVVVQDVVVGPVLAEQVAAIRSRPLYLVVLAPSPAAVARREAARTRYGLRRRMEHREVRRRLPCDHAAGRSLDRLVGADPRGDRRRDTQAGALGGCGLEHE